MRKLLPVLVIASVAFHAPSIFSQTPPAARSNTLRELRVATRQVPPFAMKGDDGEWTGISIDLWRRVASNLGLRYRIEEMSLKTMLDGVTDGSVDVAVAALTITADRERAFDFSHGYFSSGLGIAVAPTKSSALRNVMSQMLSWDVLRLFVYFCVAVIIFGLLVYTFERRRNPEQFGGGILRGVGEGIWWSVVTMTTVGYGDRAPATAGGRVIAVVWMFGAVILFSSITAAITSSVTVSRLQGAISGPQDLPRVRVGTIPSSTSAAYLERRNIGYASFPTVADGLTALDRDSLDAFVYDEPPMRYMIRNEFAASLTVLESTFQSEAYGVAFPAGSPLREPVDCQILSIVAKDDWTKLVATYLGPSENHD